MEFTIKQVAQLLNGSVEGDESVKVSTVAKIEEAQEGSIAFLANAKYEEYLYSTNASVVLVNKDFQPKKEITTNLIKVDDPYTSFTALLEEYQRVASLMVTGREEPHVIGDNTSIGENEFVGAFAYIGKNVKMGKNVKVYQQAYIGNNCVIGDNTIILQGAKICDNSIIGSYCTIQQGAVVGSDGFGFAPQKDGTYKPIPQVGNVVVEDHVNIGANTTIDCATMGSTIIRKGVKLDNLIQVAHNVEIGDNTVVAAQVGVSGSAKLGKNCVIAGQAGISGHLKLVDRTTVGPQAGVMSGTKKEGQQFLGSPMVDYKSYLKSYAVFKILPDLQKRIEELEEKVVDLTS